VGRKAVMEFLKDKETFTTAEFIAYMLSRGYSRNTAYMWITRLKLEGRIAPLEKSKMAYRVVRK